MTAGTNINGSLDTWQGEKWFFLVDCCASVRSAAILIIFQRSMRKIIPVRQGI